MSPRKGRVHYETWKHGMCDQVNTTTHGINDYKWHEQWV
jgi:hypothetical protein